MDGPFDCYNWQLQIFHKFGVFCHKWTANFSIFGCKEFTALLMTITHSGTKTGPLGHCKPKMVPNISQGSLATCLRCGGILNDDFIAKFPSCLTIKKDYKSINVGEVTGTFLLRHLTPVTSNSSGFCTL